MPEIILQLALALPVARTFDYLPPEEPTREGHGGGDGQFEAQPPGVEECSSPAALLPGCRVLVPFANSQRVGVVLARANTTEVAPTRLRRVESCLDAQPLFDAAHLNFLRWAADYYHHPVGEVVLSGLPARLRKPNLASSQASRVWRVVAGVPACPDGLSRAPRQQEIFNWVREAGAQGLSEHLLKQRFPKNLPQLRLLQQRALVESVIVPGQPDFYPVGRAAHTLNQQQHDAVEQVRESLGEFSAFLLQGVTGSGKTEVYLELVAEVLARGETALVLVPEISLTPQLQQRFADRLGPSVAVLHSALNDLQREHVWQRLRLGLTRVVLGTRSLILYPTIQLGLIVVDEEHDPSYKQQEGWRYSARDLAVVRASRSGCPVLLGSATPSLESLHNVRRSRYRLLRLDARAGNARPPAVQLLNVRDQPLQSGLSTQLLQALRTTLEAGQQAMVFLNRRGYAPVLACFSCGWMSDCPRCDARQTVHRASGILWCHHCGSQRPAPTVCPQCGAPGLHPLGQGTERVEETLREYFPEVPLIRIDRDATSRKGSLEQLLKRVHTTPSALLVGTQMLAKGHHFPRVTLVGVLDADGGLYSANFRATERLAQLLVQVAGRAGRAEQPGRVLIQTRFPDHPMLQVLVEKGFSAFAELALNERQETALPPYSFQALLRADAGKAEPPERFLRKVSDWVNERKVAGVELWGPVPAPMARRVGRYRAHLLLQSHAREPLHRVLHALMLWLQEGAPARQVRWSLDVDPLDY